MKKMITIMSALLMIAMSIQLTMAQSSESQAPGGKSDEPIYVSVPKINPLQGDKNNPIYLPGADKSPTDRGSFVQEKVIPTITSMIVNLSGGLSLLFVIISGIQILTAYDNEEKVANAKKTLTWALVGFIISILSYAIVQVIVSIKFS